jgi:hypothetical protein
MHIKEFKVGDKICRTKPCVIKDARGETYEDRSYMGPWPTVYAGWMNDKIYVLGSSFGSKLWAFDFETWQNDWELAKEPKKEPVKVECVLVEKSEYDRLSFRANMVDTLQNVVKHQDNRLAKVNEALKN